MKNLEYTMKSPLPFKSKSRGLASHATETVGASPIWGMDAGGMAHHNAPVLQRRYSGKYDRNQWS